MHPERVAEWHGPLGEWVLRRRDDGYELFAAGVPVMATGPAAGEQELARAALALRAHTDPTGGPWRVLVGGLGIGYTLAETLKCPQVAAAVVVEVAPCLSEWASTYLAPFNGHALADPSARVIHASLPEYLAGEPEPYDVMMLDIDNGPDWVVHPDNTRLYRAWGIDRLAGWLRPGGVLAVWSAHPSPNFRRRLRRRFTGISVRRVAAPRGDDYIYLGVRPAP